MTTELAPALDELLLEQLDFPITCEAGKHLALAGTRMDPCTNDAESIAVCKTLGCITAPALCHDHIDLLLERDHINCHNCGLRGPVHRVVDFLPIGGTP